MLCSMLFEFISLVIVAKAFSSRLCARENRISHLQSKSQIILWHLLRMRSNFTKFFFDVPTKSGELYSIKLWI